MEITILEIEEITSRLQELTTGHKVAILVDENTVELCYPQVASEDLEILEVPSGEDAKSIEVANHLWLTLQDLGYTRNDYLVTLGGGSISDLGGFIASTFMRGMRLIHIPTTLLAMIDASIGGKTGINVGGIKNSVGSFYEANEVWISLDFLETLPSQELLSGLGEVLKYDLLIGSDMISQVAESQMITNELIATSVEYKMSVVRQDLTDYGTRRQLNLGHTTAHALEALYLERGESIPHGVAVVVGLIVALYVSYKLEGLDEHILSHTARLAKDVFPTVKYDCKDYDALTCFALNDKKRTNEQELSMVLMTAVGKPIYREVSREVWEEALDFYRDFMG